ncbi:MAG: DUF302 domain-containing protein [Bacteroidales bacterium]|nr:DUF302 domain-containing protein [Bacteroidales bacterium]
MNYYFNTILNESFDVAVIRVTEALKKQGFGIVSEIRMHDKFKEKLNVDFKKYIILGACNPAYAYKAVMAEDKIGTMLPCNVVVIEKEKKIAEVAAVNPVASMMAVQNPALEGYGNEVAGKLQKVIKSL